MDIADATAIVVGGASGLGRATATRLVETGARVAIFDQNPDMGKAVADTIGGAFFPVDVTMTAASIQRSNLCTSYMVPRASW